MPDVISTSPNGGDANGFADKRQLSSEQVDGTHAPGDDKSDYSASRNTTTNLLSPSTDEEDLFDVPPDLPEDPAAKEESLFGRAPILSPIDRSDKKSSSQNEDKDVRLKKNKTPVDPLRDESHNLLKDPSQLFAFVTKTPSPEKSKGSLLFIYLFSTFVKRMIKIFFHYFENTGLISSEDDDSLFTSSAKTLDSKKKPTLGLFDDDDDKDDLSDKNLFSFGKTKISKDTKVDLFKDVDFEKNDEDLFDTKNKESEIVQEEIKELPPPLDKKSVSKSKIAKDIFDNSSDDEEDMFAGSKKIISKKKKVSLFDDEDDSDSDDLFGSTKSSVLQNSKVKVDDGRPIVKKAVITKDLKKIAEKIVEDPLSLLQDD